ncbi:hypothetical protein [Helicobacter pametensis]|uniref:hypothetical protein n=1 Tax=Helicobacter pametensis TaxID=95149 RepID=UPI000482FFC0|nr:hypothetical protein [Helicobacter pametensis]
MNFGRYATLSLVVCNLLAGVDYTNWGKTDFNDGDTVTIDKDSKPPTVLQNKNIGLTDGKLTVTVNADGMKAQCGLIACYDSRGPYTIGSEGSTIDFTLNGYPTGDNQWLGAFKISNKANLTLASDIKLTMNTRKDAFQVIESTLDVKGALTITGALYGINAQSSKINLNSGKKIDITANLKFEKQSTANIKLSNGSKIEGHTTAESSTINLDLSGGTIAGNFTGTNGTILNLDGSSGNFNGSITNAGKTNIDLKESVKIKGDISASGTTFDLKMKGGEIVGNVRADANTNTIDMQENSKIKGNITFAQKGTLSANGNSIVQGGITTEAGAQGTTITFKDSSKLQDGTSNFNASTTVLFQGNAQAEKETFNLNGGTTSITFQDNAKMNNGSINNQNGTANITFKSSAQMNNGTINANGGETNITAQDSASLSNVITHSGGHMNVGFSNSASFTGNITQTGGLSKIDFKETSKMTGDIDVSGGSTTTINFGGTAKITGDVNAKGANNTVTFTNGTELEGNLRLDGDSKATFTGSKITKDVNSAGNSTVKLTETQVGGHFHQSTDALKLTMTKSLIESGFMGNQASINEVEMDNSGIYKGVKQDSGSLTLTADKSEIKGGFEGTSHSINKVTMTSGKLEGGIRQNTGQLDFKSMGTSITGGFTGTNSTNTLQILRGNFNEGDITQIRGTLKAEIVGLENVRDFLGQDSQNIVHFLDTKVHNVTQSGGSLEFRTDALVEGNIIGSNASNNQISVTGANVNGEITQDTGSMELRLTNSTVSGDVKSSNATFGLYANSAIFEKNLELINSTSTGLSGEFILKGDFTQTGGTSNLGFSDSKFNGVTKFSNTTNANLVFTKSEIQNVEATNGKTSLSFTESKMKNFTGRNGEHSVNLVGSEAGDFTQIGGSLSLFASSQSKIKSVTGSKYSKLVLSLSNSEVTENVKNVGNTTISMQDSVIKGNVEQDDGDMNFTAINSSVEGSYTQKKGRFNPISLTKSSIKQGMILEDVREGSMTLNDKSSILQGLKSTNSNINFVLFNESSISGNGTATKGITQDGGRITGTLNQASQIRDGLELKNGATNLSLYNKSKISGDINATNNETTILVDNSEIEGNITVTGKFLHLTAQNRSTIKSPQLKVTNADLKLIVDTSSQFIGDLTQTGKNQEVAVKQNSIFKGSITNTDTTGTITINNATLTGNITQTGGKLGLNISNNGIVGGNVTLEGANTNLSGSGTGNQIGGNFTQANGTLTGAMNGLTLRGTYTQTGGTSSVSFTNSAFQSNTTITNATSSSLTFINSTLKNYTISGGNDNTLKLLDGTTMTGDLILKNQAKAWLKMENSTIRGNIKGSGDSTLNFNTLNSTITGNINFDTGGITGQTSNTKINGDIKLKDTQSNISFTNGSIIGGDLSTENGNNTIKFNGSQIEGGITANGGVIKLDLSNGSKVGKDVMFIDTKAHLTGSPAGNEIMGNFTTQGTTSRSMSFLTGDISSLTLHGTFTQNFGISDIIFRQDSLFKEEVTINEANSSHLKFIDRSGINSTVQIIGGASNQIDLVGKSFIQGNITTQNKSTTTITAQEGSSIIGDITATDAIKTVIALEGSTLQGNISQNDGEFNLSARNSQINSSVTKDPYGLNLSKVKAKISLTQSTYETSLNASDSTLSISLSNQSSLNSIQTPQSALLENSSLTITSSSSNVGLNLDQSSDNGGDHTLNFAFSNSSTFNGSIDLKNIKATMLFDDSKFLSPEVKITQGSLDLTYKNARHDTHREENPEVVQSLEASNTTIKITAQDQSHAKITKADFISTGLTLISTGGSRFEGDAFTLKGTSKATYTASSNGMINVNTLIQGNANTLTVNLEGGILLGSIVQDNFASGDVILRQNGGLGGRWAVSDDSKVKNLEIKNQNGALHDGAIFRPSFDTPASLVDFTLNFDDHRQSSRVGKELVARPKPLEDGTIPPPRPHQTYARTLSLENLSGNNGLFRVYTDLGTNLADRVVANKASGDHIIQVIYRPQTFKIGSPDGRIVVARVDDPTTQVSFSGTQTEIGLKRYDTEIIKENAQGGTGFEWIIGQTTPVGISYSSKIIASILQSQYRAFALETDSLDRRLGGLEKIQRDSGFWVRSFIGQANKEATDYSTSATDKYYSIWSGADYNAKGLRGHNFLGVFFNYTGMNTESKDYVGNSSNFGFGFYNVFKAYSGFYFDLLAKYIYTSSKFEISNYSLETNHPKISNHKFLANFEMGHTFYLGEKRKSLYIEPQFQITSGYIQGYNTEFVDVGGERIFASVGHNAPVLMRLGTFVGRSFGDKISANIKAGTSIAYDVNSGGELNFSDSSNVLKKAQGGDFRMLLSAHADFKFADSLRMYTSFDASFFGSYNTVFNINLGLRFVFGRRNDIVADVPMVYNPYEPTPPPIDDRRTVPVIKGFTTQDINTNYRGKRREVPSYNRGNVSYPAQRYTPQPMMRKNYRDEVDVINPNNGGNP